MSDDKQITVPEADAAYLKANYKLISVPQMAKHLKRANVTVYGYMKALGLTPLSHDTGHTHPFRISNRKLRRQLDHFRIANSKRNGGG